MRGVVALAHVTVGTPFSFVRVAFNAYTTHSIAQFHASGWLRQRCPAKRQSFPALPSDKIVYASFYPGDFPSTDGSINNSIIHLLHTIINVSKKGGIAKAINFPTRIIDNILFAELKENYDITGMPTQEAFGYLFGCNASFEDSDLFRSRYQFLMDLHSRYETMNVSTIIEELIASFSTERCSETNVARNNISYLYRLLEVSKEFELAHNNDSLSNDLEEFLDYLEMSLQDEHSAERFMATETRRS